MTTQILDNNHETLFSFELMVEYIHINRKNNRICSKELALGVRLLDFPTLLIYQPVVSVLQDSGHDDCEKENQLCQSGTFEYAFNRGKSCLFKINLNFLHAHLSNTPLYAMVLDMKEDVPKLMGTSLISLAKLIDRIKCDVESLGISIPSSQGEKAVVDIVNLMGEKIGLISMGYKLLSLGASLLPHIPENRVYQVGITTQQGQSSSNAAERVTVPTKQRKEHPPELDCNALCQNIKIEGRPTELVVSEVKQSAVVSTATQTERADRTKKQTPKSRQHYNDDEEDPNSSHPPHLFYSSCRAEQDQRHETDECKSLPLELESLRVEDVDLSSEEDEMLESETDAPLRDHRHAVPSGSQGDHQQQRQQTHDAAPSVPGDALRQLPLLNALFVELSQLNGQNPTQHQQSLSIHPNLAWMYRPVTPSPAGPTCSAKTQTKPARKAPGSPSPRSLRKSQHLADGTTSSPRREEANIGSKRPTSPPKRLSYGITKTFSLRMKRVAPVSRRHECRELLETQTRKAGGKRSNGQMRKSINKKKALDASAVLDENIDTLISSVGIDSARQGTASPKHPHFQDDMSSPRLSKNKSLQSKKERELWVRIPSAQSQQSDRSVAAEKGVGDHSDLDQPETGFAGIQRQNDSPSGSSRGSRTPAGPSCPGSRSSSPGAAEEYADDFTSLDPTTDGYSPDRLDGFSTGPHSSPEPVKTRGRSRASDDANSSSDGPSIRSERKAALPVPVRAHGSPQRSLRGTHAIRPHTIRASALSGSSDSGDGSGPGAVRAREQLVGGSKAKRRSDSESLRSPRSQSKDWDREGRGPVGGYSVDSNMSTDLISSPEPHEAKEVGDELGSLGFKNRYQHVSELVANKLPGYTL